MVADSSRESSTREVLIGAAMSRLWDTDECDLRILDICQETNLSTSVIYGHFRSRQGLIDAALLQMFEIVTAEMVNDLSAVAAGPHPTGSFVDTLYEMLTDPSQKAAVTRQRQAFFRISSTSLSRESIRPGFLVLYGRFMAQMDEIYVRLVADGLLDAELSGHQWALFFEGQMLSRAFHDLSSDWDEQEDWNRAARRMLSAAKSEVVD